MTEFEILVYPGGRTSIHVKGLKGKGCDRLVEGIVKALALDPDKVDRQYTPEYYEAPVQARKEIKVHGR